MPPPTLRPGDAFVAHQGGRLLHVAATKVVVGRTAWGRLGGLLLLIHGVQAPLAARLVMRRCQRLLLLLASDLDAVTKMAAPPSRGV